MTNTNTRDELKKNMGGIVLAVTVCLVLLLALIWGARQTMEIGQVDYEKLGAIKAHTGRNVVELIDASMEDNRITEMEYMMIRVMHEDWQLKTAKAKLQP